MTAMVITEDGAFPVPACPPWCSAPAGHDLDDPAAADYDGRVFRTHETAHQYVDIGEAGPRLWISVAASEAVPAHPDAVDGPATVMAAGRTLTAAEARRYAAALLDAAGALDKIA